MANVITGRVWTLDTVGVVFDGMVKVNSFSFTGYNAETDIVIVKDRTGRVIWKADGASDLSPVNSSYAVGGWFEGITLDTLNSGALHVTID